MKRSNNNTNNKKNNSNNNVIKTTAPPNKAPITKSKSLKGSLVKSNQTNDKTQLQIEIEKKKLPLVEHHYTKDIIDIDIKIDDSNMPSATNQQSSNNISKNAPIPHPIHQLKPKQDNNEIITKTIAKIEKMYTACLKTTEGIKLSETSTTEELLKQEVIYLKTKNEVLRLKAEFFENIFYTSKNIIETYQIQSDLKEKLIGVFTQNNQHYYESFNFLQKKQFGIFSIEKNDDNDQLINKKSLKVINEIEDGLASILKDIQSLIKVMGINDETQLLSQSQSQSKSSYSPMVFKLKDNIISCSKKILSYYTLSDNYSFEFKGRNTFWINNTDEYLKYDSEKRTKKLIEEFKLLIDPMLNKVMTKSNVKGLVNYLGSLCSFYENYNQILNAENCHLKCFNSSSLHKLSSKNEKLQKVIDEYASLSKDSIAKLSEVIEFIYNNQSKNIEKVVYSLLNTEKDRIKNMIFSYNFFIDQYMLIK